MSSAGLQFLVTIAVWFTPHNSWDLPIECQHHPLSLSPSNDDPSIPSPTDLWDIVCCKAIQFKYNNHSICGPLHSSSCTLNSNFKIETINVSNCSLSGVMPLEFMYMNELKTFDIRYNCLNGAIPSYFNRYDLFTKLQRFYIGNNDFKDRIPMNLFQYPMLMYIDVQQNKRLRFDITHLNLTQSPALYNKPAITANFSSIQIDLDNDTDNSLYILFERVRFSQFSMRSSVNHFTFKWQNKDANRYHTIYTTQSFDVYDNNISGEFPCYFKSIPWEIYVHQNFISSSDITCYESMNLETLMVMQKEAVYNNKSQCYSDFSIWSKSNDYDRYCECCFECCNNVIYSTDFNRPHLIDSKSIWFINNIEWCLLLLIVPLSIIIYFIWKRKGNYKHLKDIEVSQANEMPMAPRSHRVSTSDKESLLYGDF